MPEPLAVAIASMKDRLVAKGNQWGGSQAFASGVFLFADFLVTARHRAVNRLTISIR
jgi:hypothetical protein